MYLLAIYCIPNETAVKVTRILAFHIHAVPPRPRRHRSVVIKQPRHLDLASPYSRTHWPVGACIL